MCQPPIRDDESELFERKMRKLSDSHLGQPTEDEFERIVAIGGLPSLTDLSPGAFVDVKRLLEIRESSECHEFRRWVQNSEGRNDLEIAAQFADLHGKIATAVNSKTGKAVRFITTNGIGLLPVAGYALGTAMSAADTFLVDSVIGKPGPAAFLSHVYPSIFR
jgi:hypothetical protein